MPEPATTESAATTAMLRPSRRDFVLRKVHSLSGVVPVGLFLVFHLWTNARALQGERAFGETVDGLQRLPYLPLFEALVLLPLAFHAGYGVKLALGARYNVGSHPHSRNWMYTLQRVTGLCALVFIGYHLYTQWWPVQRGDVNHSEIYGRLCRGLSTTTGGVPLAGLSYLLGIAACAFHFANGLWSFCASWGIAISRRAQKRAAVLFGILGLGVFLLGANTVLYFATGSRFVLPSSRADSDDAKSCVAPPEPEAAPEASGTAKTSSPAASAPEPSAASGESDLAAPPTASASAPPEPEPAAPPSASAAPTSSAKAKAKQPAPVGKQPAPAGKQPKAPAAPPTGGH